MPKIPLYQPGQVGPVQVTTERFRAPDLPDSPIATAAKGAAEVLGKFASMQIELQEMRSKAENDSGEVSFQDKATPILTAARQARGLDAAPARATAEQELTKLQQDIVGSGTSPRAKKLLKDSTDRYLVQYRADLASHEAQQTFSATEQSLLTRAAKSQENVVTNWLKPDVVEAEIASGREAVLERSNLLGRDGATAEQDARDFVSGSHRAVVERRFAEGDNGGAIDYAHAHMNQMTVADQTAVADRLRNALQDRQASEDASWAVGAGGKTPPVAPGVKFTSPVQSGHVTSGYGVKRGDRAHNGVDIAAPRGSAVTPVAPGTVMIVSEDARSGRYVVVDHGGGVTSSYAHLDAQEVKPGDKVDGNTRLGPVGMTGHTTGPHVHVVMRQNGKPVDPMRFIGQSAPSQEAAATWDKRAAYANIDGKGDWSFERKQRAKAWVDQEFARRDAVQAREEREADDEAKKTVLNLGDSFKSIDQIPKAVRDRMSIDAVGHFSEMAKANSQPKPIAANGPEFLRLQRLSIEQPDAFASLDLARSAGRLTPGEFASLDKDQAQLRSGGGPEKSLRQTISGYINTFATPDMNLTGPENRKHWLEVYRLMEFNIRAATGGKRLPTDRELDEAFAPVTRTVTVKRPGLLWGTNDKQVSAHEVTVDDIPASQRGLIDQALKRFGYPVNDVNRVALYLGRMQDQ